MALYGYQQLLNRGAPWQTAAGTSLSTAITATISTQTTGGKDFQIQVPQMYTGMTFRVTAFGFLTTTATSTTATIFIAAGATPTTLCTPNGITTGTTVLTGIPWEWTSYHTITAIASSGNTINSWGKLILGNQAAALAANPSALTAVGGTGPLFAPNSNGVTAAAIDTTSAMSVMMRGTLAGANATVSCQQMLIEAMDG